MPQDFTESMDINQINNLNYLNYGVLSNKIERDCK